MAHFFFPRAALSKRPDTSNLIGTFCSFIICTADIFVIFQQQCYFRIERTRAIKSYFYVCEIRLAEKWKNGEREDESFRYIV